MNLNGIALYSIVVTIISAFSPLKRPTSCKNAGEKVKNRLCLHILSLTDDQRCEVDSSCTFVTKCITLRCDTQLFDN